MPRSTVSLAAVLLVSALFAGVASRGGMASELPGTPASNPFSIGGTADHVRIVAVERSSGSTDDAVVVVVVDPGYHINANPASSLYLIPTTLKLTNETPLRVVYPAPILFKPEFADDPLKVYEGTIRIVAEFPRGTLAPETRLFGTLTAQACTNDICLPPADLPLVSQ